MSKNITEAKIFACRQSQVIGKNIADAYGVKLGKVIFHSLVMENFNPLLKNQFVEAEFF